MLCIGHRGAAGHAPENTLLAVETGLQLGCDWIEVDLYQVEESLLIIHDETLDRTTNGTGRVLDHTVAELRRLDAGQGQKIPFLDELFALVDRRAGINVELKGPNTAVSTTRFLQQQIAAGWPIDQLLVSSFDHDQLATVHQLDPRLRLGALIWQEAPDWPFLVNDLHAFSLNPALPQVTAQMVQTAHQHGLQVYVYTVNQPDDIQRMRDLSVDAVFTDYPDRVLNPV